MQENQTSKSSLFSRLINFGMLLGGFGIGQGSLFIAQTFLVARGNLKLLAFFGTHFTFAILAIAVVEAGSLVSLSRHTLAALSTGWEPVWRKYWSVSVFRACLALLIVTFSILYLCMFDVDEQTRDLIIFFLPGLLAWSLSCAGVIDGLSRSGVSGLTGAFPYLTTSAALMFVAVFSFKDYGSIIGAALSIGYCLSLIAHFLVLRLLRISVKFDWPSLDSIWNDAREGFSLLTTQLPGQLYFRFQVLLCQSFLGPQITAFFIYSKQIVSGLIQIIAFIRRTEFPKLVEVANASENFGAGTIIRAQTLGNSVAVVFSMMMLLGGGGACFAKEPAISGAGFAVLVLAPTIFTNTISLALNQGLFALGRYHIAARVVLLSMALGSLFSLCLVPFLGLVGFGISDIVQHALNIVMSSANVQKSPRLKAERRRTARGGVI